MNKLIPRRPMPFELVNEIFAVLPLENAFEIFTGMPNGLLARNVRKMLNSIKMAIKNNKWNVADCGSNLIISDGGLKVEHSGSVERKTNCVRANLPISKLNLKAKSIAYFEVKILENPIPYGNGIGFCTQQFPLEWNSLRNKENFIGISCKTEILINGSFSEFRNDAADKYFNVGDVIGIGIAHSTTNSPLKCFAVCNGKLLAMTELPAKFADLQLFPSAFLRHGTNSIRANFGQEKWRFNPNKLRQ